MNRREMLLGASGLVASAVGAGSPALAAALDRPLPLREAAREAWLYGVALIENAQARTTALKPGARVNTLIHDRVLTTPATQWVTTPNNDTLYSRAWIDLDGGPVTITIPAVGERYLSYAFMDMYTNNFAILGTRTTGGGGGVFTLVGPKHASTGGADVVRSPTRWVWLLVRLLIDGEQDRATANAIQDRMRVVGPARPIPRTYAKRDAPWSEYFSAVQALIVENPPPTEDLSFFARIAPLGLTPRGGFDPKRFSPAQAAEIAAGVTEAVASLRGARRQGPAEGGWVYPKANLGDFGQDFYYRAQVAIGGLAALKPQEALYMRPLAPDGSNTYDSAQSFRLHFDADKLPPVDAFWSLTMYRFTPEGQSFFFENAVDRYAIGDRTPGLRRNPDGSLDIWISRSDPGAARSANWLPSPPSGRFALVLRTYLPRPDLLEDRYRLPALQPL
jgi:hypothetical protein